MSKRFLFKNRTKALRIAIIIIATASVASLSIAQAFLEEGTQAQPRDEPQPVYSPDPKDAWNRIFYHLFTRTVAHRVTNQSAHAGPFFKADVMGYPGGLSLSTRLFERVEIGDRAIEPFYPSFITIIGLQEALKEPRLSQLKGALTDALEEDRPRPALHRALMQADVWAAHDMLAHNVQSARGRASELIERASQLLPLLAKFIKKLALSPDEIKSLPDNYALAAAEHRLPALFSADSEWMEIEWFPFRVHDHAADFRRVARVFVKPNVPLGDKQGFLDRLLNEHGQVKELGAVALVIQNLLIDSEDNVVPTQLTYEIQMRTFSRDEQGKILGTRMNQYELSRKLLLSKPRSGGLVSLAETAPMYLPLAGNDYSFATPQRDIQGETSPVLSTLRARCGSCHGRPNATTIFTFNMHTPDPAPPVTLLSQPNDRHARYVAGQKLNQDDFKMLRAQWERR